jgi:hypothetical protein
MLNIDLVCVGGKVLFVYGVVEFVEGRGCCGVIYSECGCFYV